ncbi:succinate-semialdehyde dehydrogenase/glutarate-semialdehyde dehydrogenase [Pseudarthrobacter defluvii]|uniref:succinic semialdehyde dehydrogenase n=1 Tax=Pseudarthrobacter defluvii TaxID=410837 RepID=UPI002785229A|nr:succinic semialdehyde dehydrogenase [Pseudarthrobacter defluvii]MDQ0769612.1 succinate-semialdehyde dehydrogenase/glutarate-semialdehyde dehydrogenase [Pseudarthrobacter defluvii]
MAKPRGTGAVIDRGRLLAAELPQLVAAAAGRPTQASHAPFDGTLVGEVPVCTTADVGAAVDRARKAQHQWAGLPAGERRAVVRRFRELLLVREQDILDMVQAESGKSRLSAFEELADVVLTANYYERSAEKHLKPRPRKGAAPVLTRTTEYRVPKGVVGVISPWNYPLTLAVSDALPALLAGNGIVLKPDSQTPFTALLMLKLLRQAGLPADLFQIVTGPGTAIGPALIERVDFLMFTGSSQTGKTVARQCGERLIGYSAELGGKNPMLVLADADVAKAASGAVHACFFNSGQLCVSIERIYVHADVYDSFLAAFTADVKAIRMGAGPDWDIGMGSLISAAQVERVDRHVQDAVARERSQLLAGGRRRPDLGPLFYEPTVLAGVTPDMLLAREETFGPVVAVYRAADDDQAVALANDSDFGLNGSVWSARRGEEVARRLLTGTVNVNEGYAATWASHDAPIGGMKDSGAGRRHGREGILKYTEPQTIAVQRLLRVAPPPGMSNRTYARIMKAAITLMGRFPRNR